MAITVKVGGTLVHPKDVVQKIGGTLVHPKAAYQKIGGALRQIYSSVKDSGVQDWWSYNNMSGGSQGGLYFASSTTGIAHSISNGPDSQCRNITISLPYTSEKITDIKASANPHAPIVSTNIVYRFHYYLSSQYLRLFKESHLGPVFSPVFITCLAISPVPIGGNYSYPVGSPPTGVTTGNSVDNNWWAGFKSGTSRTTSLFVIPAGYTQDLNCIRIYIDDLDIYSNSATLPVTITFRAQHANSIIQTGPLIQAAASASGYTRNKYTFAGNIITGGPYSQTIAQYTFEYVSAAFTTKGIIESIICQGGPSVLLQDIYGNPVSFPAGPGTYKARYTGTLPSSTIDPANWCQNTYVTEMSIAN